MSEIAERYARLSSSFAAKVAAVPPDRWASPSPCAGWSAHDVVRHVVESQGMFLGFVGASSGGGPGVDEDPAGAFDAVRATVQSHLDDPARATAGFEGYAGPTTFEASVDRFLNFDLVVHGWDLARAAGLDEHVDAADIAFVRAGVASLGDMLYSSGACAPALDPPPGADDRTRLLAALGRKAWADVEGGGAG
ncbi:MAG TPA: TIGR03086 family metal-binding protein [Acidimicrobiales bacterium]|nr:TIGR03086 family metal-binding protein [Acidimicrobiales bacterium]